jgi:O-antigen/teichoic acid export membrane protein
MDVVKENNNTNRLINGTFIYFIGTFLSKGLAVIMLPIITTYITRSEYGYYDLLVTLVGLFVPVFTVQSIEAVFRFLFEADEKRKKELLSNVWIIVIFGSFLFSISIGTYSIVVKQVQYMGWFILYFIVTAIVTMYQRVARSYQKSKEFALSGVINAVLLAIFQTIFIILFNLGGESLFLSYILSTFITCIYLEKHTKSLRDFSMKFINIQCIRDIIKFSLPLVPNNISWWAASSLNSLMIVYFLGTADNGIYAVANRFAYILSTLANVFQMSWQETSIISYNDKDKDSFNSIVFNNYFQNLFYLSFLGILLIKILMPIFFINEYQEILNFLPILLYGTCMSCISLFYGAGYISSKNTQGAFWTTIIGAVLNIVFCYIFIINIKLLAPAISTFIAYFAIWIIRHNTMKAYFKIKIKWISIFKIFLIAILITLIYYCGNIYSIYITFTLIFLYFIYFNKNLVLVFAKKLMRRG